MQRHLATLALVAGLCAACGGAAAPTGDPLKPFKDRATAELEVVGRDAAEACHPVERWDRITVEFAVLVAPDGTVGNARSSSSDTTQDMQRCIKNQLRVARFSPHDGEAFWVKTTVSLTWGRAK